MAVKQIVKAPDKILTTPCKDVAAFDADLKNLVADLLDTLEVQKNPEGAGLAAPQLGVLKRVCIVRKFSKDAENNETKKDIVLVNPKITSSSPATDIRWEACLSIPAILGQVKRAKRVTIMASDALGKPLKIKAEGFFARTIQHEIDHLDGILFTSKLIGEPLTDEEFDKKYLSE